MKMVGECSDATFNNGIVKILVSDHSGKHPQYIWLNVLRYHVDFEQGDTVEVIVRKVKKRR